DDDTPTLEETFLALCGPIQCPNCGRPDARPKAWCLPDGRWTGGVLNDARHRKGGPRTRAAPGRLSPKACREKCDRAISILGSYRRGHSGDEVPEAGYWMCICCTSDRILWKGDRFPSCNCHCGGTTWVWPSDPRGQKGK